MQNTSLYGKIPACYDDVFSFLKFPIFFFKIERRGVARQIQIQLIVQFDATEYNHSTIKNKIN